MDAIENMLKRISVRQYSDQEITDEALHTILEAGMSGPTAVNARPWSFIVVRNPEMLCRMADGNGRAAEPLRGAKVGILLCGDLERAFPPAPDYWVVDGSIAVQNMILAANAMGIGSVWLGTWPQQNKIDAQKALFQLPEHIIPHSILALGYPKEESSKEKQLYEEDRVHFEKW